MNRSLINAARKAAGTTHLATSSQIEQLRADIECAKRLAAQNLVLHIKEKGVLPSIRDAEFRVSSQFGDDGIIQYLIHILQIKPETFIEFGVENYVESNTRFLLINNNWRGLIIDGSSDNIDYIRSDYISWRHDLTAIRSFITAEQIDQIFTSNGFEGDIGILSIDIDGVDWHIWKSISTINPVVVIVEYNSIFGSKAAVTVPYNPSFVRSEAHYSNLYYGASLRAFCILAEEKGYALVGCTSAGQNAYFVRKDALGPLAPLTSEEAFIAGKFRESRSKQGKLTFMSGHAKAQEIADMPILDVELARNITVGDLLL
ncbi:MAG: hypothetical protein QOH96_2954 [Blastocatellia bacterium]|jgi:hypothetical protein|nr:hypothetical protein [Blastocatellia bacterium]